VTPPRLARALLDRAVPPDASGESVIGDLRQEFDERCVSQGRWRARWWYVRQAASIWWWSAVAHPANSHHQPPGGVMFDLLTDLRYSLRAAVQERAQTALIVITLGLAIGTTTVGFSFADLAVLRGLPVSDPDRAVVLFAVDPRTGDDRRYVTLADFADYRARSQTTSHLAALINDRATLIERGQASVLDVGLVTDDYFTIFGLAPSLGRHLQAGDDRPGAPPVVVLSDAYWSRVTNRDPAILGRTLQLGSAMHTVVGVASPAMEFGTLATIDAWMPLTIDPAAPRVDRRVRVLGRLKPDVPLATAAAEFQSMGDALASEHPATNTGWRARLAPIAEAAGSANFWLIVALLTVSVGFVLAIACANVANILLVRASARRRDVAIRAALGASRFRIVRQLLIEGVLLSMAGAALAIPVGQGLLALIRSVDTQSGLQQLFFDIHEVGFVGLAALAAPLMFALAPALQLARLDVRGELAAGGTRAVSARTRGRSALVVVQMALAAILLCVSGLAVRTAINVSRIDPGLVTDGAMKFAIELDAHQYPDAAAIPARVSDLRARLTSLPGVRDVAVFNRLPVIGGAPVASLMLDATPPPADGSGPWALSTEAHAGSLPAMGVRVLEGRDFRPEEREASTVALMGRSAAIKYFGDIGSAVGKTITVVRSGEQTRRTIVGVVSDVTSGDIEQGPQPYVWLPLSNVRRVGVAVIGTGDPEALAVAIRQTVHAALPATPVEELETYDAALNRLVASDLVIIGVLAGFAGLALVLAAVGLYGVVAFAAQQRRAEFSTRVALGAQTRDVLSLVFSHAFRLSAVGLAVGMLGGLLAALGMRAVLIGVEPLDPVNVATVVGLLAAVTIVASLVPAIRAARADVVQLLRAN
jgi:putative ABC transport system permease protein